MCSLSSKCMHNMYFILTYTCHEYCVCSHRRGIRLSSNHPLSGPLVRGQPFTKGVCVCLCVGVIDPIGVIHPYFYVPSLHHLLNRKTAEPPHQKWGCSDAAWFPDCMQSLLREAVLDRKHWNVSTEKVQTHIEILEHTLTLCRHTPARFDSSVCLQRLQNVGLNIVLKTVRMPRSINKCMFDLNHIHYLLKDFHPKWPPIPFSSKSWVCLPAFEQAANIL